MDGLHLAVLRGISLLCQHVVWRMRPLGQHVFYFAVVQLWPLVSLCKTVWSHPHTVDCEMQDILAIGPCPEAADDSEFLPNWIRSHLHKLYLQTEVYEILHPCAFDEDKPSLMLLLPCYFLSYSTASVISCFQRTHRGHRLLIMRYSKFDICKIVSVEI